MFAPPICQNPLQGFSNATFCGIFETAVQLTWIGSPAPAAVAYWPQMSAQRYPTGTVTVDG